MKKSRNTILGLFVSDRSILCAEVSSGAPAVVRRLGRFAIADDAASSAPEALGTALGAFLKAHGFAARQAVIGLPARALLAQEKELPPGNTQQLTDVLRLHGERMSMAGAAEMVVDFAGATPGSGAGRALLIGVLKAQLDRLGKMSAAAGLELQAVTPAALAVHAALGVGSGDAGLLLVGENGAELVVGPAVSVRQLRHVSGISDDAGGVRLSSDLKRALAMTGATAGGKTFAAWSGAGVPVGRLSELVGVRFAEPDLLAALASPVDAATLNGATGGLAAGAFVPAIAVAAAALRRGGLAINFLTPRLAAPVKRRFGRQTVLAIGAGIALLVGAIAFAGHVSDREREAIALAKAVSERAPVVKDAQAAIDRAAYGRGYFVARPPVMEALREVTMAFDYGEPIWVSTFTLRDNGAGQLQGRAAEKDLALTLLSRLEKNPSLKDTKLLDLRDAGGKTREVIFSISFIYEEAK